MVQGEVRIPLELKSGMGPHLQKRWETRGSSQVVAVNSGFLSRCGGDLWTPLHCMKGVKPPLEFGEGTRDYSSRHCRNNGPHVERMGESAVFFSRYGRKLRIPLQVPRRIQGASCVASGKSSLHSSYEGVHGITLDSRQGNQASIPMEGTISRCISRLAGCLGSL